MRDADELLTAARFDDKLRTYWYLQFVLILLATVVGILILPIWLLGWGQWYVRRNFEMLMCELHERTLVVKRGIFFRVEKTIPLDKIQDLTVKEGPLLRWLGLRSMKIETAGQGTPGASEAHLIGIVDPIEFRDRVLQQRDAISVTSALPSGTDEEGNGVVGLLTEIRDLLSRMALVILALLVCGLEPGLLAAQTAADEAREGPYSRLVIANAMVIPGHGGPAYGPADIIIEDSTIVEIRSFNGVTGRPEGDGPLDGDRVIDATGMYVMPGLIDLHTHIRTEPLPLQYVYNLKLAHGVTTMVNGSGRGWEEALEQQRLSAANEITAPRMFPIRDWGPTRSRNPGNEPPLPEIAPWHDASRAPELARQIVEDGAHVIRVGSLAFDAELFGAVAQAIDDNGAITTVHLPPSDIAVVDAVRAAELGVTMIEHHYGFAESALGGEVQGFPGGYNFLNELDLFRQAGAVWQHVSDETLFGEVVDRLVASGVSLIPTMSAYEVNRDVNRAMGLPWHEKLTHRQLIEWYYPSPEYHAAHHWDWTSGDEAIWFEAYRKWGRLIREFQKRGGHLSYAADDPYLWNTSGIANVRELQLMRQAGLDPLEVIRAATRNSAVTLRRPDLGLLQTGYTADLLIVDGNPLHNLRYLYAFGALERRDGQIRRTGGVRWTIKNGVVFDNARLIEQVMDMVAESKEGWTSPVDSLFTPRFKSGR